MIIDAVKRAVQVVIFLGGQASAVITVITCVLSHFWAKLSSLSDVNVIVGLLFAAIYVDNICAIQFHGRRCFHYVNSWYSTIYTTQCQFRVIPASTPPYHKNASFEIFRHLII
ncbi:hypothetical protein BDF21DRAFT_428265 [Thamnidium elegans]|nr:hypothetical protein BDF21DRAFT_428265 [Thamnidium elegans]